MFVINLIIFCLGSGENIEIHLFQSERFRLPVRRQMSSLPRTTARHRGKSGHA